MTRDNTHFAADALSEQSQLADERGERVPIPLDEMVRGWENPFSFYSIR